MNNRNLAQIFLLFSILIVFWAAIIYGNLRKPLIEDDVEFAEVARNRAMGMKPVAHFGQNMQVVLTHPQLYHFLLAICIGKDRSPEIWGRVPGIICFIAICLLLAFSYQFTGGDKTVGVRAALLYGTNPWAIQSMFRLDEDSSLNITMATAITLWLVFFERDKKLINIAKIAITITGIAALWWTNYTMPLIVGFGWVLYRFFDKKSLGHAAKAFLIQLCGLLLFAFSWWLYCRLEGLDALAPFSHIFRKLGAGQSASLSEWFLFHAKHWIKYILWLSPYLAVVFILVVALPWVNSLRRKKPEPNDLILFILLPGLLGFAWLAKDAFGFLHYETPLLPLLMLSLAPALPLLPLNTKKVAIFLLAAAYFIFIAGDTLYPVYTRNELVSAGVLSDWESKMAILKSLFFLILPSLIFVPLLWGRRMKWMVGAALGLGVAWGMSQSLVQARATYSTYFEYGEEGVREVAQKVVDLEPAMAILPKDIAYYMNFKVPYYISSRVIAKEQLAGLLEGGNIDVLVIRFGQLAHQQAIWELNRTGVRNQIEQNYLAFRHKSFIIYRRKP